MLLLLVKSVNTQCNLKHFDGRHQTPTKIVPCHTEVNKRIFPLSRVRSYLKNYLTTKNYLLYDTLGGKTVECFYSQVPGHELTFCISAGLTMRSESTKKTNTRTGLCALGATQEAKLPWKIRGRKEAEHHMLGFIWHTIKFVLLLSAHAYHCISPTKLFPSLGSTNLLKKCHW